VGDGSGSLSVGVGVGVGLGGSLLELLDSDGVLLGVAVGEGAAFSVLPPNTGSGKSLTGSPFRTSRM